MEFHRERFTAHRPAPSVTSAARACSAPFHELSRKRSARSLSPNPRWATTARRFFGVKSSRPSSRDGDYRGRGSMDGIAPGPVVESSHSNTPELETSRSSTPSGSIRSRDMSPDSLRRFLLDDTAYYPQPAVPSEPATTEANHVWIPEDMDDDVDDDANFATSAVSESAPFTRLSPPPHQRVSSTSSTPSGPRLVPALRRPHRPAPLPPTSSGEHMMTARPSALDAYRPRLSLATTASDLTSPPPAASPHSTTSQDVAGYSFFDDTDDDEDLRSNVGSESIAVEKRGARSAGPAAANLKIPFTNYSLPQQNLATVEGKPQHHQLFMQEPVSAVGMPPVVTFPGESDGAGLLSLPRLEGGMSPLAGDDMNWIAEVVQPKDI